MKVTGAVRSEEVGTVVEDAQTKGVNQSAVQREASTRESEIRGGRGGGGVLSNRKKMSDRNTAGTFLPALSYECLRA